MVSEHRAGVSPERAVRNLVLVAAAALAMVPATLHAAEGTGGIRGSVSDRDVAAPLSGVRVTVVGTTLSTLTDTDGHYVLERVPAGEHTLIFSKDGYEREVANVLVTPDRLAQTDVQLNAEIIEMEELVVTGADLLADSELGLLEIRAEAVTVQDSVSTEIIKKAGVSDVAGALRLVVGASVNEGKYATVRGLSDRYTGTTVNGVRIPSTDPRRRAVQLDLFPTGTIDGLTVTKTFTPDLQGDFTGGGVDIKTKGVPDGPQLAFTATVEHDNQATHNPRFLTYDDGGVGRWGFRKDQHELPSGVKGGINFKTNPSFFPTPEQMADAEAVDRITRSFDPVIGTSTEERPANHGFSLVGGNRFSVGGGTLGFISALTYTHKYELYEDGQNNLVSVDAAGPAASPRSDNQGTDRLLMGLMSSVVWSRGEGQEYGLTLLGNQATQDEARLQLKQIGGGVEQNQSLHYTERIVGSIQLHGSHRVGSVGPFGAGPWKVSWLAAHNLTEQDEPDVRFFRNEFVFSDSTNIYTASQPASSPFGDNTRRIWREIDEDSDEAAANVELPFLQWAKKEGKLKAGLFVERGERDFTQNSYTYIFPSQPGSGTAVQANKAKARFNTELASDLWTDAFLDPDRIGLADNRCPVGMLSNKCSAPNQLLWFIDDQSNDVEYTADQDIDAAYAMTELPLSDKWDLVAGARYETTFIRVEPVNPITGEIEIVTQLPGGDRVIESVPQDEAITEIDEGEILPALVAVWKPRPQMNVRLSYSRTIARPQVRELAPAATEEFLAGDEFVGNPELSLSNITNWDARWEWFRKAGEVLAASVFYKDISDPIELISFTAAGRNLIQPVNYATGRVHGAEIETRFDAGNYFGWARGFTAGANWTWLDSEVDVPEEEQQALATFALDESRRALQGQPAYLLNLFLTYDNEQTGSSAGLFYSRTGETLLTGAATGIDNPTPNVFERSYGLLNLSATKRIMKNVSLSGGVQNLLETERGSDYRALGSEAIKTQRDTARRVSISLGAKW